MMGGGAPCLGGSRMWAVGTEEFSPLNRNGHFWKMCAIRDGRGGELCDVRVAGNKRGRNMGIWGGAEGVMEEFFVANVIVVVPQ